MGICCLNLSDSQSNIIVENKVKTVIFPQYNKISSSSVMTSNTQPNITKTTTLKGPIISKITNRQRVRSYLSRQSVTFT